MFGTACDKFKVRMTEQKEIQLYNDIYRYLKDSEYRPNATKNDKRAIRRRACSFVLRDGLLYFTEDGADSTAKQWIVDKESQMKVITSCHDQKLGESRCYLRLIFTGFTCS